MIPININSPSNSDALTLDFVIDVENLSLILQNKDILIVDTRAYSDYAEGHIPGAVNIDLMQFHWIDTSIKGIKQFNEQSKILLSNIGVTKDKFVVFYDDISGSSSARGVWLLLYFSHKKVAMLDGGLNEWKKKGYSVETKNNPFLHSNFRGRIDKGILADYSQLKSGLAKKNMVIVDARSNGEYRGSLIRAARKGHIPSAVNIDWNDNLKNGIFKSRKDLEKIYSKIPKDARVATYCQGGYRAANTFVVLKMLGYSDVKMYLGSWGEWGNRPDLPVEQS